LSKFKSIEHAFFNRLGGKSTGIFKSLNCGPGSSDKKDNVLKNLEVVGNKIKARKKKNNFIKPST
jgi:copper oxidase (laccase) domain-containing protein